MDVREIVKGHYGGADLAGAILRTTSDTATIYCGTRIPDADAAIQRADAACLYKDD